MAWIVGFISQKGGVGKSTESRALAREATSCCIKTKLADLDLEQGTMRMRLVESIKLVTGYAGLRRPLTPESYLSPAGASMPPCGINNTLRN